MSRLTRLGMAGPQPQAPEPTGEAATVIGPQLAVDGRLESAGVVRVHGMVTGDIAAGQVIVEADGTVEGDIVAREVEIRGRIRGGIVAPTVSIAATAAVEGSVLHHRITVESGAMVDGRMPWRPMNYFADALRQLQGDDHEHVYEDRESL